MTDRIKLILCLVLLFSTPLFATDWFVRPPGGNYGAENGTDYSTAWDGLTNVVWGAGGVQPGDTLWVCGLHYHRITSRTSLASQGDILVPSGTSESARIVIRGDHPNDPGVVWGAYLLSHEAWIPEGSNAYSITIPGDSFGGNIFEDVGKTHNTSYNLLSKKNSLTEVQSTPGSYFSTDYQTGSKLYVHSSDSGNPSGRIFGDRYGYEFVLDGKKYVTFKGLTIYHPLFHLNSNTTHIRWDSCTLMHGEYRLLTFRDGNHYMEVLNCELAFASTLIYNISNTNNAPSFYRYAGNTLHHSAYLSYHRSHLDPHAMGIQGGNGGIIEDNYIYLCGDGFIFYTYAGQDFKNTTIRRNFIKDGHSHLGPPEGITFGCNDDSLSDKTGNKCYQNIVCGQYLGIKYKWEHEIEIFNNIVFNCDYNFLFKRNFQGHGPKATLRNNVSLNPRSYHIHFSSDATDFKLDSDHNLFYPDTGNLFYFYSHPHGGKFQVDLAGWQKITVPGFTFDPNSMAANPLFRNGSGTYTTPTDFKLQSNSPAVDSGVNMGVTTDFEGTTLPQGFGPDIGAYECRKTIYSRITPSRDEGRIPLTINFVGEAAGNNPPFTYQWDFGDNSNATGPSVSHTYTAGGSFNVTLTVTDSKSNVDTVSLPIYAHTDEYQLTLASVTSQPAPAEGGTTTPPPGSNPYPRNSTVSLSAVPNNNYRFARWTGDIDTADRYSRNATLVIDRDKSITANFSTKCGDINGDLSITPSDAQLVFDIYLGRYSNPTFAQRENADVNCDGGESNPRITPSDAQAIFDKFLGRRDLPCSCSGKSRTSQSLAAKAASAGEIHLDLADMQIKGSEFRVPIMVANPYVIESFGFDLIFPSHALDYMRIEGTSISSQFTHIDAIETAPGRVRVGGFSNKPIRGAMSALVILVFKAKSDLPHPIRLTITSPVDDMASTILEPIKYKPTLPT